MEYKQLGNADLSVSGIGFGSMSLASLKDAEAVDLLQHALNSGINYFDTADLYEHGRNERLLGKAFAGKRSNLIISTKVGNQWREDGSGWDWNPRKEYILKAADESLKRLQTDYIDLYLLHGGTIDDDRADVLEAFTQLKKQGKIRYFGISSIRPNVVKAYLAEEQKISADMLQYSLADRRPEEEIIPVLADAKVGILVRGAIAQGLLCGKPSKEYLGHSAAAIKNAADAVASISGPHRSAAQTAIRYVLHNPSVTSAVIGIRDEAQLADVAEVFSTEPLNDDEYLFLRKAIESKMYAEHR